MPYGIETRKHFKTLIDAGELLFAPGVSDGLSAKLTLQAGFPALYISGGAIARSMGRPDIGIVTVTQMAETIMEIATAIDWQLPLIADADTGFGNAVNIKYAIENYELLGVSALHIEDQTFPKRCGHLDDKSLIPTDEMCTKVKAACAARKDPNFMIIARTDAIGVEGFESAIQRACAYKAAGADMIFVEAPQTLEQITEIAERVPGPKLLNMFHSGKTPVVAKDLLKKLGYSLIIIPSDLQRAAIKAMQTTLQTILRDGHTESIANQLVSFKEREDIIETKKILAFGTV